MKNCEGIHYDYEPCFFNIEVKEKILALYLGDMTISDISSWVGLSDEQVNIILDSILPNL